MVKEVKAKKKEEKKESRAYRDLGNQPFKYHLWFDSTKINKMYCESLRTSFWTFQWIIGGNSKRFRNVTNLPSFDKRTEWMLHINVCCKDNFKMSLRIVVLNYLKWRLQAIRNGQWLTAHEIQPSLRNTHKKY